MKRLTSAFNNDHRLTKLGRNRCTAVELAWITLGDDPLPTEEHLQERALRVGVRTSRIVEVQSEMKVFELKLI